MADNNAVLRSTQGRIGILTVNNPPVNALSQHVRQGLHQGLKQAIADSAANAIVIVCAGRTFIAGADITEFGKPVQQPDLRALIVTLETIAKPTVAAIHGTALGGGLEVTLACHYRVGTRDARFGLPEVKLGVFPPIAAACFPQLIGYQQAAKLILTGATIPAVDAVRLHLATEVAPDEELSSRLETLLSQLRSASATTLRLTKRALLIGADRGVSAGLESIETLYLTDLMATADAAEGINAFMEKRPPAWRDE